MESESLIFQVLKKLQLKVVSLTQISHEDSLSSLVYRITTRHESCILKFSHNKDRWQREQYYLSTLRNTIPVPKILAILPPDEINSGVILMEELKGEVLKASKLTDDFAFTMGEILAKLHSVNVDFYGDLSKRDLSKRERTYKGPIQAMQEYFERSFHESSHIVDKDLLMKCEKFVLYNLSKLSDVDGPHIIHRDYRPGNVVANEDQIVGIIDFENTLSSFAEEDFAQMDVLVWKKYPTTKAAFLEGYSTIRALPQLLDEVLPLMRVLKALGAIGFTHERKSWQSKHNYIFTENVEFLTNFLK